MRGWRGREEGGQGGQGEEAGEREDLRCVGLSLPMVAPTHPLPRAKYHLFKNPEFFFQMTVKIWEVGMPRIMEMVEWATLPTLLAP